MKTRKRASNLLEVFEKKVIGFPKNPLFPDIGLHTIIADKSGEAFILAEGMKKNIVSHINNDFIVMTNFPNGDFEGVSYDKDSGRGPDRYICAHQYIDNNVYVVERKEQIIVAIKEYEVYETCPKCEAIINIYTKTEEVEYAKPLDEIEY